AHALAEPLLGDGERFDVILQGRGEPGRLVEQFGERDVVPAEERRVPDDARFPVDVAGNRHAQAVRAVAEVGGAVGGGSGEKFADQVGQCPDDVVDVVALQGVVGGCADVRAQVGGHADQVVAGDLDAD